ncbi:hypothetical protein EDD15DRAFT_2302066 [Pisolithus albus]|nr:hypothetical protein EDD15DRAFT_2302066 [Pisolithus albus]
MFKCQGKTSWTPGFSKSKWSPEKFLEVGWARPYFMSTTYRLSSLVKVASMNDTNNLASTITRVLREWGNPSNLGTRHISRSTYMGLPLTMTLQYESDRRRYPKGSTAFSKRYATLFSGKLSRCHDIVGRHPDRRRSTIVL